MILRSILTRLALNWSVLEDFNLLTRCVVLCKWWGKGTILWLPRTTIKCGAEQVLLKFNICDHGSMLDIIFIGIGCRIVHVWFIMGTSYTLKTKIGEPIIYSSKILSPMMKHTTWVGDQSILLILYSTWVSNREDRACALLSRIHIQQFMIYIVILLVCVLFVTIVG